MRYLLSGSVCDEKLDILIEFTNIKKDSATASALRDHFVRGMQMSTAAEIQGLKTSNFQRSVNAMNKVAGRYERLKELEIKNKLK